MRNKFKLKDHLNRFRTFYEPRDPRVPSALFKAECVKPDLEGFPYPLPSKKSDYTCCAETPDAVWFGASTGLTRYDKDSERECDRVMYFSAPRDLPDNNVRALLPEGNGIWVLTDKGAAYIEMKPLSTLDKCNMLLAETLKYVDRRGMVSQRGLRIPGDLDSMHHYSHSDNDGSFTAGFAMGEVFKYATLKREKGADDPETLEAKRVATRAVEACLLLLHIPCRGDGFAARTYLCPDEPVPDDGIFFRIGGGKAVCIETTEALKRGCVGTEIYAGTKVPERLAKLYTDLGYTTDGLVYKADTSSDEVTHHFAQMLVAHEFLACDDPELDELIKISAKALMKHIIDSNYEFLDFSGQPTTWAKWSTRYFDTDFGWGDAPLNAAEVLMYHLVTMRITGEQGEWRKSYEHLINDLGYADISEKHFDRLYQMSLSMGFDFPEEIMYGDHMLAVCAFTGLCLLEKEETLLAKYRAGFKSWRTSLEREHNPGYDIPFMLSCPDEEVDLERMASWFYRTNISRLAAGVSCQGRHDVPVKKLRMGSLESSVLLEPDETFISKYDRNPLQYQNEDSGGSSCVESCYIYTFAYWIGRFFGFFE